MVKPARQKLNPAKVQEAWISILEASFDDWEASIFGTWHRQHIILEFYNFYASIEMIRKFFHDRGITCSRQEVKAVIADAPKCPEGETWRERLAFYRKRHAKDRAYQAQMTFLGRAESPKTKYPERFVKAAMDLNKGVAGGDDLKPQQVEAPSDDIPPVNLNDPEDVLRAARGNDNGNGQDKGEGTGTWKPEAYTPPQQQ